MYIVQFGNVCRPTFITWESQACLIFGVIQGLRLASWVAATAEAKLSQMAKPSKQHQNAVRSSCSSKGSFVMDIMVTTNLTKSRQNGVFKFSSGESTQSTLEVTKSMCSSENIIPCRAVTFLLPLIYVNTTKLPFWQIERVVTKHIIHAASQIVSIYI